MPQNPLFASHSEDVAQSPLVDTRSATGAVRLSTREYDLPSVANRHMGGALQSSNGRAYGTRCRGVVSGCWSAAPGPRTHLPVAVRLGLLTGELHREGTDRGSRRDEEPNSEWPTRQSVSRVGDYASARTDSYASQVSVSKHTKRMRATEVGVERTVATAMWAAALIG